MNYQFFQAPVSGGASDPNLTNSSYAYVQTTPGLTNSSYAYVTETGQPKPVINGMFVAPSMPSAFYGQLPLYHPVPIPSPINAQSQYGGLYIPPGYTLQPIAYPAPGRNYSNQTRGRSGYGGHSVSAREASPNPYARLPQYGNQQSDISLVQAKRSATSVASEAPTIVANGTLPNVFEKSYHAPPPSHPPIAPQNVTLNKHAMGSDSLFALNELDVTFEPKNDDGVFYTYIPAQPKTTASTSAFGKMVLRDYSSQSLEDLRALPSFSVIQVTVDQPTSDVETACPITSHEKLQYFPEASK